MITGAKNWSWLNSFNLAVPLWLEWDREEKKDYQSSQHAVYLITNLSILPKDSDTNLNFFNCKKVAQMINLTLSLFPLSPLWGSNYQLQREPRAQCCKSTKLQLTNRKPREKSRKKKTLKISTTWVIAVVTSINNCLLPVCTCPWLDRWRVSIPANTHLRKWITTGARHHNIFSPILLPLTSVSLNFCSCSS